MGYTYVIIAIKRAYASIVELVNPNMNYEKAYGVIIFRIDKEALFLLLHKKYKSEYWDLVKGHAEGEESDVDAVKRELNEETGITEAIFLKGFKENKNFFYKFGKDLIRKDVVYFLAEVKTVDIKISFEHDAYKWVNLIGALKLIKFKNTRELIKKANKFIIDNIFTK